MAFLVMDPEPFLHAEPVGRLTPYAPPVHDIVHELTIAAEPKAVFEALTTARGLARWWDPGCATDLEADATLTLPLAGGDITVRVGLLEAPELVQWEVTEGPREWAGTTVAIRIEELEADVAGGAGPVSLLNFWHGGWPYEDGLMPKASFDWALRLAALRDVAEQPV
jgi:hypothetical protein